MYSFLYILAFEGCFELLLEFSFLASLGSGIRLALALLSDGLTLELQPSSRFGLESLTRPLTSICIFSLCVSTFSDWYGWT